MSYSNLSNTLVVTKTLYKEDGTNYEISVSHTRDFLEKQLQDITSQRDAMILAKESELTEVTELLEKCDELGITVTEENINN